MMLFSVDRLMEEANHRPRPELVDLSQHDEGHKKRKLDIECHEILPPDLSSISALQKLLRVDLWCIDKKAVCASLKQLGDKLSSNKDTRAATHRLQFHRCQGASVIVGVMHRWYQSSHIQALCCLILHNASFHDDHLILHANDVGIMDIVTWAMRTFDKAVSLQHCACGLITRLVTCKENAEIFVNKWRGLQLVSRAMRNFPDHEGVQKWSTSCLDELMKYGDFHQRVLDVWVRQTVTRESNAVDEE